MLLRVVHIQLIQTLEHRVADLTGAVLRGNLEANKTKL